VRGVTGKIAANRTSAGLSRWLTTSGGIGKTGERFELTLRDGGRTGERMTGQVLAITASEVALGWDQIRGLFELKAFSMGPGNRMLGLRCLGWKMDPALARELEGLMEAALDRLAATISGQRAAAEGQR
jgi:hypothetical protein